MAKLSPLQVAAAAYAGGFTTDAQLTEAVQVAYSESLWDTAAANACCNGLWQINKGAHSALFNSGNWQNPIDNAKMAHSIYAASGGWCTSGTPGTETCNPWQSFGNAKYLSVHAQAVMAVAQLHTEMAAGKTPEQIVGQPSTGNATPNSPTPVTPIGSSTFDGIVSFFKNLVNPAFWKRTGLGLLGVVVILVGIYFSLPKQSDSFKVASKIVGNVS